MRDGEARLVYSTDGERVYASRDGGERGRPRGSTRRDAAERGLPADPGDGTVRLHRGRAGRGGGPSTLVVGLPGGDADLDAVLRRCKQRFGTGGTRQGRVLVIQGDHREVLRTMLEQDGHRVKLAGG